MSKSNPAVPANVHNVGTKASATLAVATTDKAVIPMPKLDDPEAVKAYIEAITAQNAELQQREAKRQQEVSFKERIDKETRFGTFRNNLIIRRTSNPEEVAPAADVFDLLEVSDLKGKHFAGDKKRIYISNREFATYQQMKAEGIANITYTQLEERLKKAPAKTEGMTEPEGEGAGEENS